jgi:hypothetical protein
MFTEQTYNWIKDTHREHRLNSILSRLCDGDEVHRDFYTDDVTWLLSERATLILQLDGLRNAKKGS